MARAETYRANRLFITAIFICTISMLRAQTPVASFTPDKITGCAPLMVNFSNTSTGAISYYWNFGNSNTSTAPNPSTVFITPGTFTVKLVATSANGTKDSTTTSITVVTDPVANFSATPTSGCEDDNVISFTNLSTNAVSYIWDFGDGTSSNATNPTHTYTDPGVYSVKLVATSTFGCQNIKISNALVTIHNGSSAAFNAPIVSACNVNTIFQFNSTGTSNTNWQWSFGDGTTSTNQNPTHQFPASGSYNITLITTNNNGCKDTLTRSSYISIGNSLIPSFTISDTAGCGPLVVDFNCTVPNATSWLWTFGNGNTSTLQNPTQTFTNPGNYSVSLSVTTQSGCNGSVTIPNLIIVDSIPIPNFSVVQDSGCVPFSAQMINLSSNAATYNWAFGNLTTSTQNNPNVTFTQGGFFSVTLTAISANGCQSSLTKPQLIRVLAPKATYNGTPRIGCPGMNVQFSLTTPQSNIVSYWWNFGDGTHSTLQSPSHVYNSIGNFPVSLIITNSFGCKDTVYRANYITIVNPITPYTLPDTIKICLGDPHTFLDPTYGGNQWDWNFGDGSTSIIQNPSYTYLDTGVFIVTLTTSMAGGCSQTFNPFAIVQVVPYIKKPIDMNVLNACKPYQVNFSTTTPNVVNYTWSFGDGQTSTLPNPTHIYQAAGTYSITLTMTIGSGCVTQQDTTITLGHQNPIQISSTDFCVNTNVNFSVSNPADFTSANWNFDDGTTGSGFNITHQYVTAGSYNPTLITGDNLGCTDTFQLTAPIIANDPIPNFSVSNQVVCLGSPITFINSSQNTSNYNWNFGDGNISSDSIPTHLYDSTGTFTVSLTATSGACSVTKTNTAYINVVDPLCDFNFTTNGMCMPVVVNFTSNSPSAVSWLWDFGNGTTSTLQNPNYTFLTTPTSSLSLTITDINGCTKTKTKDNISYYNANASVDNASGCIPQITKFTDLSNGATSWLWDFGDGTTSTQQNPTHTYTNNGIFSVTLICEFPGNCIDTTIFPSMITIQSPLADFFAPTTAGCSPTQISFTNTSVDGVSFDWRFGDGGTSTNVNPNHIYYLPGSYTITLIVTNSFGCVDTAVKPNYIYIPGTFSNFSISSIVGCESLEASFTDSSINAQTWSWNFGDGYIDSIQNPSHIYADTGSYVVTLITTDSLGCSSSFTFPMPVNIYPDPIADASVTNTTGCSSFTTNFINQSLYADSYLWLFDDGDTSNLSDPSHTFLQGGLYQPSLIAITQYGCRDTFQLSGNISVLQSPEAIISASDTIACEPGNIIFSDASTLTTNPTYQWIFGNGTSSTSNPVNATYLNQGNYTATLIVTNSNGCSDSTTANINILASPIANGLVNIAEGCHPLATSFTNLSSNAISNLWNYGNGDTSLAIDPNYIYNTPGVYNPYLVAYNALGCTDTFFLPQIIVHATPIAMITPDVIVGCNPTIVTFTNNSTFLENPVYSWDFNDGNTSSLTNPQNTFVNAGTYNVSLNIINTFGCQHDTSVVITINPTPTPIGSSSTNSGCSPLAINFTNQSTGADYYLWDFGNGDNDTTTNPSYIYQSGGIFVPLLIAYTNLGCSDTITLPTINVNQSPSVDFSSNIQNGCKNDQITYINNTSQIISPSYSWNFGFTNSTLTNPIITYSYSGIYDVTLIAINSNGCSDTLTKPSFIEIYDSLPPTADPIMSVTVVNNSQVDITWQNNNASDLKTYILYRLNPSTGMYLPIHVDTNATPFSTSQYSVFSDLGLNTLINTYTYKLQTIDICGNTLPLDSLIAHTTINITALQSGNNIAVNWTPYGGCQVGSYDLFRTEVATGQQVMIATLSPTQLNFLDTTLICPLNFSYKVIANALCGTGFNSSSDTSVAAPINIFLGQKVEIIRSTIVQNKSILTEWLPPAIHPDRVLEYQIYRSDDNVNFNLVAVVPKQLTFYTDEYVNVNEKEYYYHIVVANDCNFTGDDSNLGTSIFLQGSQSDRTTLLNWTKYQEWSPGVDTYQVERLDINGNWGVIKVVDGNTTSTQIDE